MLVSTSDTGVKSNSSSFSPALSGDGTRVGFTSNATNLDAADTDNGQDVYVKDVLTDDLSLVSTSFSGVKGDGSSSDSSLSVEGRWVAFRTLADNFDPTDNDNSSDIYLKDLSTFHIS